MIDLSKLETEKALELNAALQKKKNALRKILAEKGIMEKDKKNEFDRYTYFSESGYKRLFTELFSACGLELTATEKEVADLAGTDKQPFGRRATLIFTLTDTDTGYFEVSEFSGEGLDKGDKGIYKAYTGALKYYLASTFNVATGDDPEQESPDGEKQQEAKGRKTRKTAESDEEETKAILGRQINDVQYKALLAELKRTGMKLDPKKSGFADLRVIDFGYWRECMNYLEKIGDAEPEAKR